MIYLFDFIVFNCSSFQLEGQRAKKKSEE